MKKLSMLAFGALAATAAWADDLSDADEFLCSVSRIMLCVESGTCHDVQPWEADVPQFVVIDTREKLISTTRASAERRSTPITSFQRQNGQIHLQGLEGGRAFSFVIDEATGLLTVAVSRDGMTVSVFGACTNADVEAAT